MLDTNWIQPSFNIIRAAYAELVVADLEKAKAFYVDVLGFVVTAQTADRLYLRGYEERFHHSLVLRQGATAMVDHLAFRVGAPQELDALAQLYEGLQCPIQWSMEEASGQQRILKVQDPFGFPIRFFSSMAPARRLLQRYDLYRDRKSTRLNSSHTVISYAVFCLKKKKIKTTIYSQTS